MIINNIRTHTAFIPLDCGFTRGFKEMNWKKKVSLSNLKGHSHNVLLANYLFNE